MKMQSKYWFSLFGCVNNLIVLLSIIIIDSGVINVMCIGFIVYYVLASFMSLFNPLYMYSYLWSLTSFLLLLCIDYSRIILG
jgi:hypothetical protein